MAVLTRGAILRAAEAVLAREGLAAVTMRAVAAELGVTAAALYYHFPSKNDLIGAIVDLRVESVLAASASVGVSWQERARALAVTFRDTAAPHPELVGVLIGQYRWSPPVLRLHAQGTAIFENAGFPPHLAMHAYRAVMRYVIGHVTVGAGAEAAIGAGDGPDGFGTTPPAPMRSFNLDEQFDFGLDLLVESLERRLANGPGEEGPP